MLNPVYCLDYACFFHAARRRQVWFGWGKVLSNQPTKKHGGRLNCLGFGIEILSHTQTFIPEF
jgi:hypothetical protein